MRFVNKIEEETGISKVMLDLEGLVLPEKELSVDDTECRVIGTSDFELVNKFLKTLSEDESKILASGLVDMHRTVNKISNPADCDECVNELTNILTNMLQNPDLVLFDKLCSFSSDIDESYNGLSTVWHPLFCRWLLASSLLSSMCVMTFNQFLVYFSGVRIRNVYRRWNSIFVDSIKQSGKRGMALIDYTQEILSASLENCDEDRKLNILGDIISNPAATTSRCIEYGVARSVIEFVSQRIVSSIVARKWHENRIFASPEFGKLIVPDGVRLGSDLAYHIRHNDTTAIDETVQQLLDAGNDKVVVDKFIDMTKGEVAAMNAIGQELERIMHAAQAAKEKQDAEQ